MSLILPVDIDGLLRHRGVESERVEFKASWDPKTTGPQALKTICAFANDYHNLNGGYVVIGVAERDGRAALPPAGLSPADAAAAQKWIREQCNRIDPPYRPICSPETVESQHILVVWAPASDMRPHRAPGGPDDSWHYWVRLGAETVDAERRGDLLHGLMQQAARVPWDDRAAREARLEDMVEAKVREHLRTTGSGLIDIPDPREVYQRMRITRRVNDHEVPRNAGLLFFARYSSDWFRGAKIEVARFAADRSGNIQEEHLYCGGLADQLRECLNRLQNLTTAHLQKRETESRASGWASYPLPALRETLVNAVYHRGYSEDQPDPTKIYLYPGRIEITSYPGPVPGIELRHLRNKGDAPAAPARNRRIGELLKELGFAEGRLSGIPKVYRAMEDNGSPEPRFEFDDQRTYFRAILPAHPEYEELSAARDAAHLRALGQYKEAFHRIETTWEADPSSAVLAEEMIRLHGENSEFNRAEEVLEKFKEHGRENAVPFLENVLVRSLIAGGDPERATGILESRHRKLFGQDAIEAAIMARRARNSSLAHKYFESAGELLFSDPRALLEFAQTKLWLALQSKRKAGRNFDQGSLTSSERLASEARGLLEHLLQMDASPTRHAWAWRELARALDLQRAPIADIELAYKRAIELLPRETRFTQELERVQGSR